MRAWREQGERLRSAGRRGTGRGTRIIGTVRFPESPATTEARFANDFAATCFQGGLMFRKDGSSGIGSIRSRFGEMADPLSDKFNVWVPIAVIIGVIAAISAVVYFVF